MLQSPETWRIVLDYGWGIFSAIFLFLFSWVFSKLNDTYSKQETKEMIDLKILPLVQSLDTNSRQLEKQTTVLEKLNDNLMTLHEDSIRDRIRIEGLERRHPQKG
jgi:hypothetical protein